MKSESAARREEFYNAAKGRHEHPVCNLCGLDILPGQAWDRSHYPVAKAFGGKKVGIAHARCNRDHGAKVVTPAAAKAKRVRRRHFGITRPGLGRRRMPGGRHSPYKLTIDRQVIPRLTLREKLIQAGLMREDD